MILVPRLQILNLNLPALSKLRKIQNPNNTKICTEFMIGYNICGRGPTLPKYLFRFPSRYPNYKILSQEPSPHKFQ